MIHRFISEWDYLPITDGEPTPTSISRVQANRLLGVARSASAALKLGGTGEFILLDGHRALRAGQVVGLLVADGISLEILPKIEDDAGRTRLSLVGMLARTLDLPIAHGELTKLSVQGHDLLEILIRLFCDRLFDQLHRGLPRQYVFQEGILPALRGSLDVVRQFTKLAVSPQKLACRFHELSHDIAINQVLKATVSRLRTIARGAENQRRLNELQLAFADVTEVSLNRLPWNQITLDRTNRAWASLLNLAKLLLKDRFQTTSSGAFAGFSLLFEMNTLFEEFIGRTLQKVLRQADIHVTLQGPKRHTLIGSDGIPRFATIPDIFIHDSSGSWILDTKWKRLRKEIEDPKHGVSQADVYQMMAYASVYRCNRLMLLYPHHSGLDREAGRIANFIISGTEARLVVASVDLSHLGLVPEQLAKVLTSDSLARVEAA